MLNLKKGGFSMKNLHYVFCTASMILFCLFVPVLADTPGIAGGAGSGGGSGSSSAVAYSQAIPMPVQTPGISPPGDGTSVNYSKLSVSPQYLQFRMKPGEKEDLSFSVTNKGTGPVSIKPAVIQMPYSGPSMLDSEWVAVSPAETEVAAGGKSKYTVSVSVPADAVRGYYSGQIALTDEQYPSMYPMPYPSYVHTVSISTEVTGLPALSTSPYMLGDSLQAGSSYDYDVTLKNNADHQISISPKITSQMYVTPLPYGGTGGVTLTDDAFTLTSPGQVPANGESVLHVHIDVPSDASGYYNGMIDLGADDPSIQNGEGTIQLSFMVWKQPDVPFVKSFTLKESVPLTIELTATKDSFAPMPASGSNMGKSMADPSLEVSILGPDGKITPAPVKTVIKGSVYLVQNDPSSMASDSGPYQDNGEQFVSTYTLDGKAGQWTLTIMPHNLSRFDYSITMGADGDLAVVPVTTMKNQTATPTPVMNSTQNGTGLNSTNISGTLNKT
jgi:hypothetical protein